MLFTQKLVDFADFAKNTLITLIHFTNKKTNTTYIKVEYVSSKATGVIVQIMAVIALPPRLADSILVNFESR